eukprot:5954309-Pleurochrysis_carterae.AAC.1
MRRARGCSRDGSRDRIASAKLYEPILQKGQQACSARCGLGPSTLLVDDGVVQLPHKRSRRLPAK